MVSTKQTTPTPSKPAGLEQQSNADNSAIAKQAFIGAALSMSWQLAIVVLIPVVGGFKLDERFKSSPLWTIVGFVVAICGMVYVVRKAVKEVTPPTTIRKKSA